MSDEQTAGQDGEQANEAGAGSGRQFRIEKVYLKDASFESPAAPGIFSADAGVQPQVNLQLNTENQRVGDDLWEITLVVTVTGAENERTVFLAEIKQAGLFRIGGFEEDAHAHLVGAHCPSILFPFAREALADLVQRGGLPQLVLQPINFDALYAQHRQRQQENAAAGEGAE